MPVKHDNDDYTISMLDDGHKDDCDNQLFRPSCYSGEGVCIGCGAEAHIVES